jgi:hypothetical protein
MQEFAVRSRPPASAVRQSAPAVRRLSRSPTAPAARVAPQNAGTSALSGHDFARVPVHTGSLAADPAASMAATSVAPSSVPPSVQRDPVQADSAPPAPAGWQGMLVNAIASGLQLPSLGTVLLARFGQGIGKELGKEGPGALGRLAANVVSMTPGDFAQLLKGYVIGLPEGIVSPVTDLFGLGVFAEQILNVVADVAGGLLGMGGKLAAETEAVRNAANRLLANAGQVWERIKGADLRQLAGDIFGGAGSLPAKAGNAAERLGSEAADAIIAGLESPWEKEQPEEAKPGGGFHPLAAVQSYVGGKVKQLVGNVPWAKVGEKVGYAIGFAFIQVIILVFTDGIGNAIEEGAAALGRFASSLGSLGKAVGTAAEFLGKVGKAIGWVENLAGKVMGAALKPLEKLLQPILEPLTELLGSLRTWLRKLFGVVEKEGAALEKAAAAKAVSEADKHVHAPPPPEGKPAPHQAAAQHAPPHPEGKPAPHQTAAPTEHKPPAADVATPAQPTPKPPTTQPTPTTQPKPPAAPPKLPELSPRLRGRLNKVTGLMEEYHLSGSDIGFRDARELEHFLNTHANDAGMAELEARVNRAIDVRGTHAAEISRGTPKRAAQLDPSSPEGRAVTREKGPEIPQKSRLPQETPPAPGDKYGETTGGTWSGTRGHSEWQSDDPRVLAVTKGKPIKFTNGKVDLEPWAKGKAYIKVTGNHAVDEASANAALARQRGWLRKEGGGMVPNAAAAERYMKAEGLTWHHVPGAQEGEMLAVPTALHANVPHIGSAAEARAAGGH